MAAITEKGSLFPEKLVTEVINMVKGKSSLAKLTAQRPIPFNGSKEFTFTMDKEVDIVAENGEKSNGGITVKPVTIMPLKIEYGARITDEFLYASEEAQIDILKAFTDGFAMKVSKGLDIMAYHGVNPRTKTASAIIGTNCFEKKVTQKVKFTEVDPDTNVDAAVALVEGSDREVNGLAMSSIFSGKLAAMKVNGVKQFPELAWGASPAELNGLKSSVNSTISANSSKMRAVVGDFANMFKWGYAKEVPLEIIKYGDPDNSGQDLKGYGQVYIRAEIYLGWGIFDPDSFAIIEEQA